MTPLNHSLARHYLAAVTAATISIEIAQARALKALSDSISGVVNATQEVPKIDALMIRSSDFVTSAFADAVTAIGLTSILVVFALAMSRNKAATLACCLLASVTGIVGVGAIGAALVTFVPLFEGLFDPGTPASTSIASAVSLPEAVGTVYWLSGLALTLVIAFLLGKSTIKPSRDAIARDV